VLGLREVSRFANLDLDNLEGAKDRLAKFAGEIIRMYVAAQLWVQHLGHEESPLPQIPKVYHRFRVDLLFRQYDVAVLAILALSRLDELSAF
jgi:hypothetical protein